MKNFKIQTTIVAIALIFIMFNIFSCIKKNKEYEKKQDYIIAKIDGYDFKSCFKQAVTGDELPDFNCVYDSLQNFKLYAGYSCSFNLPIAHPKINLKIGNVTNVGTYKINEKNIGSVSYYFDSQLIPYKFITDSINQGLLNITNIDKTKRTISGTFEFTAYCAEQNKYVNVKSGLFNNISYTLK